MSKIEQRLETLGISLPAPLQLPPGTVLPFPWVTVIGSRARSAVGLAELPFNIPVEIEGEVQLL